LTWAPTAALSMYYEKIGIIWIDAHGDFNTEETTISGNIHGMSFATSCGRGTGNLMGKMGVKTRVSECKNFKSLEVVELNPILDRQNVTGKLAIGLISSAFGKKIL